MSIPKIHAATAKRAAAHGITLEAVEGGVDALRDDEVLATAETAKEALDRAIAELATHTNDESEDAEDRGADSDDEPRSYAEASEELDEDDAPKGNVVPQRFREVYEANGGNNGDALANALTEATTVRAGKESRVSLEAVALVAEDNDAMPEFRKWEGRNPGMIRMNLGNVLRGRIAKGKQVTVNGTLFDLVAAIHAHEDDHEAVKALGLPTTERWLKAAKRLRG